MATPFDSIGGLLGIDPEQLKQLMAAMGPQEEDRKAANMQALTQLGLGLLGTRKGYEWEQLGNAGQNALMARQQAMQGAQAGRIDQIKMAEQLAKISGDQNARKAAEAMNQRLASLDMYGGGDAEGDAPPPQKAQRAYDNAMRKWQIAIDSGDVKRAEGYLKAAESVRVKYGLTPQTMMKDGKPVLAQMSEFGDVKEMTGYAPKPEYKEVDTGKQKMFYDPLTGAQGGQFAMQTTPNADQSAALQRAQMAQTERHWQAGQGGGSKPQLVNGQWVFPPDAQNPTGRAVTPEGFNAKETAVPQAFKDKNTALKNLGNSIDEYNKSLEKFSTSTYTNPTEATRLLGRYTSLKMDLKNLYELGALAGPDIAILEEGLTDPASIKGFVMPQAHFTTQTQVLKDRLTSARKNLANSYGQPYEQDSPASGKTIVRTGTNKKTGKRVILYSDGTQVEQ